MHCVVQCTELFISFLSATLFALFILCIIFLIMLYYSLQNKLYKYLWDGECPSCQPWAYTIGAWCLQAICSGFKPTIFLPYFLIPSQSLHCHCWVKAEEYHTALNFQATTMCRSKDSSSLYIILYSCLYSLADWHSKFLEFFMQTIPWPVLPKW